MQKSEKIIIFLLLFCIVIVNIIVAFIYKMNIEFDKSMENKIISASNMGKSTYEVYQNSKIIEIFYSYDEAILYAEKYENSSIKKSGDYKWIWDSNPPYEVYQGYNLLETFLDYKEALTFAKKYENSSIFYRKNNSFIWHSEDEVLDKYHIKNVPFIGQYPELARGCEVTSLAMLLNYKGFDIDKLLLAKDIEKQPFSFNLNNTQYNGNPHIGFVGDMYSLDKDGYGVYNEPIYNLMDSHIKGDALNLTGVNFEDLYYYINKDSPILIITNTKFDILPESDFLYLNTTRGNVKITYREHAVLVTGYDDKYIYYNDPMYPDGIKKQEKNKFIKAWEQMGSQSLTYAP